MKRIFAFISAIFLGLVAVGGVLAYRNGDLSVDGVISAIKGIFIYEKLEEDLPLLPTITEEPVFEEENLTYDEHLEKGDYYYERGFLTFASNEYVRAANLEPDRVTPYRKLLRTHFELRNYSKALNNAEIVLQLNPNDLETRYDMIRIYVKLSDFDTAKNLADQYPATQPPDARVLYYKGLLSALFGAHDQAQKLLKEAKVATNDSVLSGHIDTVLDAYQEFNFTKAAEELYRSELLARSFNKAEEYEMAIHMLKDVLKARSDLRDGWILLGFAYLNLEKYQFALTAFDKAYSLDSEWPTTQYFLGITHKELGNFDDSIVYFNYALNNGFEPEVVLYRHLADLYFETQDYAKSVEAYERVLEVSKGDVNAFIRPVWLYIDFLGDSARAVKLAETAVLNFPQSAMSYNLLGWSYIATDETKAERNLKKALELDPNLAAAYYNLGQLYEAQHRTDLALETYQKAYELDNSGDIGNMAAAAYNELLKASLSN